MIQLARTKTMLALRVIVYPAPRMVHNIQLLLTGRSQKILALAASALPSWVARLGGARPCPCRASGGTKTQPIARTRGPLASPAEREHTSLGHMMRGTQSLTTSPAQTVPSTPTAWWLPAFPFSIAPLALTTAAQYLEAARLPIAIASPGSTWTPQRSSVSSARREAILSQQAAPFVSYVLSAHSKTRQAVQPVRTALTRRGPGQRKGRLFRPWREAPTSRRVCATRDTQATRAQAKTARLVWPGLTSLFQGLWSARLAATAFTASPRREPLPPAASRAPSPPTQRIG